jgi:hypothetical protein
MGPYQLKHWISHFGFKSQVIDFCQFFTAVQLLDLIAHFIGPETLCIGVSSSSWSWSENSIPPNIIQLMPLIKDRWPNVKIVLGGPRKRVFGDLFDASFAGDAEDSFTVWLQEQAGKKGMSLFNKKFNITQLAHRFDDSDCIFHDEVLPIELGRGCIFKCKFCGHHNIGKPKHTYQRGYDLLLDELRFNYDKFGVTKYNFLDDTVNEDVDKVANLSKLKDNLGFDIQWTGYLRADLVWSNKGSAEQLAQSGMKSCFFGIETFNQNAAQSIGKGWSAKHAKDYLPKLFHDIWKEKINIYNSFIVGLPNESKSNIIDSVKWCIDHPMGTHRFNALSLGTNRKDNFKSEFATNYHEHGYFDVDENTGAWNSNMMTSGESLVLASSLSQILNLSNTVSAFLMFSAMNLGFTSDEIATWKVQHFDNNCEPRIQNFLAKYIDQLKSIKD